MFPSGHSSMQCTSKCQEISCTSLFLFLQLPLSVSERYHTVVLVGCVCCLVQAMFTLFLLLPYWWHHRTCLIFLKLQCCTATSGAMGVFIYAVRDSVPKVRLATFVLVCIIRKLFHCSFYTKDVLIFNKQCILIL
jgi:hypothetical protein